MRKLLFGLMMILLMSSAYSQIDTKEAKSKMDVFTSKTGTIIKIIDYSLPNIKSWYGGAKTNIREVIRGENVKYFYQITKKTSQANSKKVSIAYEDLVEVVKAIVKLKDESVSDVALKSDYLENRFITDDDFEIGYYVKSYKFQWYVDLDNDVSNTTIIVNKIELIESAFKNALKKIEELKLK